MDGSRYRRVRWRGWAGLTRLLPGPLTLYGLFISSLFVASVVHLLEDVLLPLEGPARLLAVNRLAHANAMDAAPQPKAAGPQPLAILKINRETFRQQYRGRQPLDRCQLKADVLQILDLIKPKRLGIDLDLSPVGVPKQDRLGTDLLPADVPDQNRCAKELIEALGDAQRTRCLHVALILPIDRDDRHNEVWWRSVEEAGLTVADPSLIPEWGMVRRHWLRADACPSLGVAVAGTPVHGGTASICSHSMAELPDGPGDAHDARHISFHRLVSAWVDDKDDRLLAVAGDADSQVRALQRAGGADTVLLGAAFDQSDDFLTPIGTLSGVEVHAAVAANPDEPFKHVSGFLIDVVLGVVFGAFVHAAWQRYFRQRLGPREGRPLAYLWLVGLMSVWVLVGVVLLPALSIYLLAGEKGWWINPVPMLVGMSLDAFVVGSVQAALHHGEHQGAHHAPAPAERLLPVRALPASERPLPHVLPDNSVLAWRMALRHARRVLAGKPAVILALAPRVVWWAVVLLALFKLMHSI